MKPNKLLVLVSILIGLLTMPLGLIIWPPAAEIPFPDPVQFLFFVGVAFFEAIGFGAGLYFLVDGYRLIKTKKNRLNTLTYLSIVWLLMSWWPHDRLHTHIGEDVWGVLILEYAFHATSIIAAIIIVKFFYRSLNEKNN
jgi:hypothetical protein